MKQFIMLAAILVLCVPEAFADNFRCPNGSIVSSGDSISEVMVKCDPPSNKIKRTDSDETSRGRVRYIEVEEWTYNEGPHTLVHYLTFTNGVLTDVKTGTFGR